MNYIVLFAVLSILNNKVNAQTVVEATDQALLKMLLGQPSTVGDYYCSPINYDMPGEQIGLTCDGSNKGEYLSLFI